MSEDEKVEGQGEEVALKVEGPEDDDSEVAQPFSRSTVAGAHFQDHYTLNIPSSSVRFRGSTVRVDEMRNSQLQLEERENKEIFVKNVKNDKTLGMNVLRGTYSLFCLFFAGVLFVFSFQVLLFLFMDLVVDLGVNDQSQRDVPKFMGTLFAVPNFVYGLASAMTIAGTCVGDTWRGRSFLNTVGKWSIVWTEWAAFVVLLGIPVMTWIVALLAGSENWWQITALTWFSCVTVYCVFFGAFMIYYEIQAAMLVLHELCKDDCNDQADSDTRKTDWLVMTRRAIILRQVNQFAGSAVFVRMTNIGGVEVVPRQNSAGIYTRTTLCCIGNYFFHKVDPPQRLYSLQDILGVRQFLTANSWSLEKTFCTNARNQSVAIVRGPHALLPSQMKSSFVCSLGGNILAILFFLSFLAWFEGTSGLFVGLVCLLIVLSCIPRFKSTVRIYRMYRDVLDAREDTDEGSVQTDGIYQTFENYRITRPSPGLCWTMFFWELIFFFVWPVVTLFVIGNYPLAGLFLVVCIISAVRYFLNPAEALKELGSFDLIGRDEEELDRGPYSDGKWRAKSRLSAILLNVTTGPRRRSWTWVFVILAFICMLFAIESLGTSTEDAASDSQGITILPQQDFAYNPQPDLPYPTCRLAKGLEIPSSNSTALADYAFLASMAYESQENFQNKLDMWFGEGVAKDEVDIVAQFRGEIPGGQAAVSYHFVTFPGSFGVVVVRGSTTAWEWLTDAQLWSGAALFGVYTWMLPFGDIFTPIIAQILKAISWVESDSLDRVALYRQTTSFVEALQATGNYTTIHITGHSLGGGISLITGAQTAIPAIGVSGPNCMLSRLTFKPPLTEDAINRHLFNIVPDQDLVPRVDDLGDLFQRIQCRGKKNDIWACHSIVRSLCEIIHQCGTVNRPALCDCATKYGYPPANQTGGGSSFTDLCGSQRSNDG